MLASDVAGTVPESTAVTLSLPLLNGTITRFVTPASFSISATKCGVLPLPAVAQFTPLSPALLAHATNSCRLLAGTLGFTTITDGAIAIMPTGTSSLSSYGRLLLSMLLVTTPAAPMRNVYPSGFAFATYAVP